MKAVMELTKAWSTADRKGKVQVLSDLKRALSGTKRIRKKKLILS